MATDTACNRFCGTQLISWRRGEDEDEDEDDATVPELRVSLPVVLPELLLPCPLGTWSEDAGHTLDVECLS